MSTRPFIVLLLIVGMILTPQVAHAKKVSDISRLGGQRTNVLTGIGMVFGLKGTGDGGDFRPAVNPLAAMLEKFNNPATVKELAKAKNVAVVMLQATVPANGVRKGDKIDLVVMSTGAATSLAGGRLFVVPMTGPVPGDGQVFALADGALVLEDPTVPTVGVIKGGCVMEQDVELSFVEDGKFTLVLDDPSADWTTASAIAKLINDSETVSGETLAVVRDSKVIEVTIPRTELARPDAFISRIQRLPVPELPTEARIQINDRTATMIITGDVEISPVIISHKGLTITTYMPKPVPSARVPILETHSQVVLDPADTGGAKLQDLVIALEQLKVPAEDRIAIIKELHKTGRLHAKLIVE
jgi:flagellar P-ring protein FlgI